MDQHTTSEAGRLTPLSSNAEINRFLIKIDEKVNQLKMNGMMRGDQALLKNSRLNFIWGEPIEEPGGQNATKWRKARARRAYTDIQDANNHVFLAVVLVIPPTECAKTSFDIVVEYLTRLENYEPYRLNLRPAAKKFFESTAAEQGFTSSRGYLSFMQALFPQSTNPSFTYDIILTGLAHVELRPAKRKQDEGMQTSIPRSRREYN